MADPGPSNTHAPHDERVRKVELAISTLLRVGVVASLLIVVAGTIVSFAHHPDYVRSPGSLQRLTRTPDFPHTPGAVWDALKEGRGQAIVIVGLLLLVATPVLRVAISILAFVYQHDRVFTVITAVVLALLLLSFFLGKAEG